MGARTYTIIALFILALSGVGLVPPPVSTTAQGLPPRDYDIVYVRSPRPADSVNSFWPEATTPLFPDPGANLMLLHADGTEEVLFAAGVNGAVMDPYLSYDAHAVVFAFYPNVRNVNPQRGVDSVHALSHDGADIYKIDLQTRQTTRLTFQEFTPNTGNGADFNCQQQYTNCPNVGIFNTGPAFLPDGRIVFTSTRDNFIPNKATNAGQRAMQLYVMDGDGKNVQGIGTLNVSTAMHPFVLRDGRIVFTSWENMGVRDDRVFPLWALWPDGTSFEPFSGFGDGPFAHHFMTQITNGDIVTCRYYNFNNNGFGELYRFPVNGSGVAGAPLFQPIPPDNAASDSIPLQRVGYTRITPFTFADDFPAPCRVGDPIYPPVPCQGGNNTRVGKFTLPSAGPNNELLVVYTRGAANHNGIYVGAGLTQPFYDGGIYRMRGDQSLARPDDLTLVKNDPNYNEMWPRAVLSYQQIYGVAAPVALPELKNDGTIHAQLPEGTPLGLIGTSSLISRDTRPFRGDAFYPHENNGDRNWFFQGADAGLYTDSDIYAVRILALQPITDRSYPDNQHAYASHFDERVRILGEVPVRKEGVFDQQGNVDTSFLAKIPADVPFTFQTLNRQGLVLNGAQTWHQVRPGEMRVNCGGCHAHSKPALDFNTTAAAQAGYQIRDLAATTPLLNVDGSSNPGVTVNNVRALTLEYLRDIRPILQAKCSGCHSGTSPAAGLNLNDDNRLVDGIYPATYAWLTRGRSDENPTPPSVSPDGSWYHPQATRYIRKGQARQSLLVWKLFGQRLDGRANSDRPTETVPGDPNTIPGGVSFYECDLDYTGTQMPPPDSGVTLTWDERMKIARWIDIGCPIDLTQILQNLGRGRFAGFLEDDLRPTLALTPTVARAASAGTLTRFVIGAYDLDSGLNAASLTLTLDRAVGGFPPGTNLAAGLTITAGSTVTVNLPATLNLAAGPVTATLQILDQAGHTARIVRTYRATAGGCSFALAPTSQNFGAAGGGGTVNVTTTAGCNWSVTGAPAWVTINSGSSGTGSGVVSYTVAANTGAGRNATLTIAGQSFAVTQDAACPAINISPTGLPNGFVGAAYNQTLTATGGAGPYAFTVTAGALPNGMSLSASGGLSGAPTATGTFNFTVTATGANSCAGTQTYIVLVSGPGLQFYPLPRPIRLLDTRPGFGNCDSVGTPINAGTSITTLARTTCESITIPATAQAVVGNLTVINQTAQPGYLTIYPDGQTVPLAANMIYSPGAILSNNFTVGLSSSGKFNVFGERTIDVVVDISGYYAPPGTGGLYYHPLSKPVRLLDTRAGFGNCDSISTPIPAGTSLTTLARTTCETLTIPAAAQAIVGNATVINGSGQVGYLTIYPNGVPVPLAANIIYFPGQILSNAFTTSLNANGEFNIFGERTIDMVLDIAGYYSTEANDVNGAGLLFTPLVRPLRIMDTRGNQGNCDNVASPILAGTSISVPARITCESITIPAAAQTVIGTVTVINPNPIAGYMTMYPDGVPQPLAANMVYFPGQILSNAFAVGLNATTGQFRIFGERTIEAIVDVSGYFAP